VSAVAYAASMVVNYLLQRSFTFRSERPHRQAVGRYALVHGVGITLNAAMLEVLVGWMRFSLLIVQGAAVVIVAIWSYLAQKVWVFVAVDEAASSTAGDAQGTEHE